MECAYAKIEITIILSTFGKNNIFSKRCTCTNASRSCSLNLCKSLLLRYQIELKKERPVRGQWKIRSMCRRWDIYCSMMQTDARCSCRPSSELAYASDEWREKYMEAPEYHQMSHFIDQVQMNGNAISVISMHAPNDTTINTGRDNCHIN